MTWWPSRASYRCLQQLSWMRRFAKKTPPTSAPMAMRSFAISISATKMVMLSGRMAALLFSGMQSVAGLASSAARSLNPRHPSVLFHAQGLAPRCQRLRT